MNPNMMRPLLLLYGLFTLLVGSAVFLLVDRRSFSEVKAVEQNFGGREKKTVPSNDDDDTYYYNKLPNWMLEYASWHREQRVSSTIMPRVLLVRCMDSDRCGGFADRLKSFQLALAVGAKSQRLLLLHWSKPCEIDEFLNPGPLLDWSVSPSLLESIQQLKNNTYMDAAGAKVKTKFFPAAMDRTKGLIQGNVAEAGNGYFYELASQLDRQEGGNVTNRFNYGTPRLFHDVFHALFRPSAPIQALVDAHMSQLKLTPNRFHAAHYRSLYPSEPFRKTKDPKILKETATHAIECADTLGDNNNFSWPVYFASDNVDALISVQNDSHVVSYLDADLLPTANLHLNFAEEKNSTAYYSVFVDIMIMSHSRCVSYGSGGFGVFASTISFNASCSNVHSKAGKQNKCGNKT